MTNNGKKSSELPMTESAKRPGLRLIVTPPSDETKSVDAKRPVSPLLKQLHALADAIDRDVNMILKL